MFAQLQLLFFNVATFTIVCILHIESHFFMCGVFPFFSKKCFKIQPQTEAKKNIENLYQQGSKIVPKSLKFRFYRQIAPKQSFFRFSFFASFFALVFSAMSVDFWSKIAFLAKSTFKYFHHFWCFLRVCSLFPASCCFL